MNEITAVEHVVGRRPVDPVVRARAGRAARRTDAPLPAAVPLLLQPARTRARQHRAVDRRTGRTSCARPANSASCRSILSGGEPTARKDLEEIVEAAAEAGLYTNLITAGVLLTRERLMKLAELGLDHVQLSIQDVDPENADRIAAYKGGIAKKIEVARWVKEARPAADHQRADAPPEHRQPAAHHRLRGRDAAPGGSRSRTCSITPGR